MLCIFVISIRRSASVGLRLAKIVCFPFMYSRDIPEHFVVPVNVCGSCSLSVLMALLFFVRPLVIVHNIIDLDEANDTHIFLVMAEPA